MTDIRKMYVRRTFYSKFMRGMKRHRRPNGCFFSILMTVACFFLIYVFLRDKDRPPKGGLRTIPPNIWFTYKTNKLQDMPPLLKANVHKTIRIYKEMLYKKWKQDVNVNIYDDTQCRPILAEVFPKLVPYFDTEKKGMYRGDMCRVALLWKYGGYYFDLDIEVIRPVDLSLDVEFASSFEYPRDGQVHGIFQAFLASRSNHPILMKSFEKMLLWYERPDERGTIMGTEAMFHAFNEAKNRGRTVMLEEVKGNSELGLKDWSKRLMSSEGCLMIVRSSESHSLSYFYSRILGIEPNCPLVKEHAKQLSAVCQQKHIFNQKSRPDLHICFDRINAPCIIYSSVTVKNAMFDDFMENIGCEIYPVHLDSILNEMVKMYDHKKIDVLRIGGHEMNAWSKTMPWDNIEQLSIVESTDSIPDVPSRFLPFYKNRNEHKLTLGFMRASNICGVKSAPKNIDYLHQIFDTHIVLEKCDKYSVAVMMERVLVQNDILPPYLIDMESRSCEIKKEEVYRQFKYVFRRSQCTIGSSSLLERKNVVIIPYGPASMLQFGGISTERQYKWSSSSYVLPGMTPYVQDTDVSSIKNSYFLISYAFEDSLLYTASMLGTIPVVIGPKDIVSSVYGHFNGGIPPWIFAKSLHNARQQMSELLADKYRLATKISDNFVWWKNQVLFLQIKTENR